MRLLLADDDLTSRQMLQAMLAKWGFDVAAVRDGDEAWEALNAPDHPKLAILDWIMPGMDGLEVVRGLREKKATEPHYIIILTSRDQKKDIAEALNAGADDYLTKPYDIDELLARIGVGVRVTALQAALAVRLRELNEANATIAQLACTDELTRLANRRSFNEMLTKEVSGVRRHGYPLSLIMADLDRFKHVNDSYGHDAGDRVLKAFADLLVKTVRLEDFPARWGGEEFVVLLPHTDAGGASRVAERIRTALEQARCSDVDVRVTASFGVASLEDGESGESLLRRADSALMRAKLEGRDRVLIAGHDGEVLAAECEREPIGRESSVILIVDDDPTTVMMLSSILRQAGFETATASDGNTAIEMSESLRPDLIILDLHLPDMDGLTVCGRVRGNPAAGDIPILFMSANEDISTKTRGFDAGGADYITKPLVGAEVIARVITHLRLKQACGTLARLQAVGVETPSVIPLSFPSFAG